MPLAAWAWLADVGLSTGPPWPTVTTFAGLAVVAALVSLLLVRLLVRHADRLALIDVPNSRSSHEKPTPRGGGGAIVLVVSASLAWLAVSSRATSELPALAVLCLSIPVALVSGLNDLRPLPAVLRLIVHLCAAIATCWLVGTFDVIALPRLSPLVLGPAAGLLTATWIVGLVNAYNFMDGIDGIAASQAVVAGRGLGGCGMARAVVGAGPRRADDCRRRGGVSRAQSPSRARVHGRCRECLPRVSLRGDSAGGRATQPSPDGAGVRGAVAVRVRFLVDLRVARVARRAPVASPSHPPLPTARHLGLVTWGGDGDLRLARRSRRGRWVMLLGQVRVSGEALLIGLAGDGLRVGRAHALAREPGEAWSWPVHLGLTCETASSSSATCCSLPSAHSAPSRSGSTCVSSARSSRVPFLIFLGTVLVVKPLVFFAFGLYRRYWRYANLSDLVATVLAVSGASVVTAAVIAIVSATGRLESFPVRSSSSTGCCAFRAWSGSACRCG